MKLLMLKGLPASGKSTWAKGFVTGNPDWVRVNKDDLRGMFGRGFSTAAEKMVLDRHNVLIELALIDGKSVIVDNTNFHPKHEKYLRGLAASYDAEFEIKMFDTPLEECILRDAARPMPVGPKVIKKMWREYVYKKVEAPAFDSSLPNVLICDLDGTLALHNGRSPYDAEKCDTDVVNLVVWKILRSVDIPVVFATGREEKYREKTQTWIDAKFKGRQVALFMRPTGDFRPDDVIKQEIYDTEIKGQYNVGFVLDDRNRVVDMWRRNGLTCLQVADGNF